MHPKITTSGALALRDGVKCIVYGPAGVGKTRLCATMPRPLILSAEKGTLSLKRENIPVWPIETMKDMIEAVTYIGQSAEARQFDSVGLDSISDLAEITVADALKKNKDPRKAYGEYATEFMNMLRYLRALQMKHIYFIAKESYDKDEMTGQFRFQPMMPGRQLTMQLPYLVDECFRMIASPDGTQKALQTMVTAMAVAKDRSGSLQMYEQPDLGMIFQKIMAA